MTALASITLQEASVSVSFTSIPQNYRDLILVSATKTAAGGDNAFRVNEATTNYSTVAMYGAGSSNYGATSSTTLTAIPTGYPTTGIDISIIQLLEYSATDKHKVFLDRYGDANASVVARASRWASTNAITSIILYAGLVGTTTFNAGSTFDLYGRIA